VSGGALLEKRTNLLPAFRATVQQKSSPEGTSGEDTEEKPEFTNWVATEPAIQLLRPAIQLSQPETRQQ
jgi:hypothetical protein